MIKVLTQFCVLILAVCVAQDAPEVTTEQGSLRGSFRKTWKGKSFRAFTGIPYAKAALGDLRFKAAVPAEPWQGVLDASKSHAICPQIDVFFNDMEIKGDEDCLYLNVYAPQIAKSSTKPLPVLFFVHGGGFTSGSANDDLYGPDILLDQDVILVTANYRLGALGFLSTEDNVAPGNNGLKDQNLALKWTKINIAHFGGNPQRITIFGQSAGGASAHYHVLSPLSKDLLFAAIAQSGIGGARWALAPKGQAVTNAKRLAEFLNCPTGYHEDMIECLKKIPAYKVVEQDNKFMEWNTDPLIPFKPVVEANATDAFLTQHPVDIIKSGNFAHIPFMTGFTTEDGAIRSAAIYNQSNLVEDFNKDFERIAPIVFQYQDLPLSVQGQISKKIRQFYLNDRNIDNSTKSEITNMCTDAFFLSPHDSAVELHAKYSKHPVYYYLFGYRGSMSISPFYGDPSHDYGVVHCDEQIYQFSNDLFHHYKPTESDKNMNDMMTTLWVNFARTGNPTPETNELIQAKWEPVHGKGLEYYFIKSDSDIGMAKSPYMERSQFWRNLFVY